MFATRLVQRVPTGRLTAVGLTWVCVGLAPMLFSARFAVVLPSLIWVTLAIPAVNAALVGFFFGTTPEQLQGRVGTVMSLGTSGLAAFAPMAGGFALVHAGYLTAAAGAVAVVAVAAVVGHVSRVVRSIPTPNRWESAGHDPADRPVA